MAKESIQKIILAFTPERENLLPLLHQVNENFGYLSEENIYFIADYFKIKPVRLLGIISTSKILKKEPPSALEILVCDSPVCASKCAEKIIKEIEKLVNRKIDKEATKKISFKTTSCLGRCDLGPVMMINGNLFTRVKPSDIDDILKSYLAEN